MFDSSRNHVVLFGGRNTEGFLADTWELKPAGQEWAEMSPPNEPSPRNAHALAFDTGRAQIVLFGGFDGVPLGDTWIHDGSDWTEATVATAPSSRSAPGMVHDSGRGMCVLFGGFNNTTFLQNETWVPNRELLCAPRRFSTQLA